MPATETADIVIIGGGIVGLAMAREIRLRYSDARVVVFEKEPTLGKHASGRNSGVLHSGIYYPSDSLKAKLCVEGARLLAEYCEAENLTLKRCGKVVLPTKPEEDGQLDVLYQRAHTNGATAELIDNRQLRALEPEAESCTGRALHVPATGVFDPNAVLLHLAEKLQQDGVRIILKAPVTEISPEKRTLWAGGEQWSYNFLINTAGLHADRIARRCGLSERYTILPFKGMYSRLSPTSSLKINGLIYPVPDLEMPFLGVHFTRALSGTVYLGPSAFPALGRENYDWLAGLDLAETPVILARLADFYLNNRQNFRKFTHLEAQRLLKPVFVDACRRMVPNIMPEDIVPSGKVGIRAQLIDTHSRSLVMDFLVERHESSLHVLNAVSPAFTSAFAFARYVLDSYFEPVAKELAAYGPQR